VLDCLGLTSSQPTAHERDLGKAFFCMIIRGAGKRAWSMAVHDGVAKSKLTAMQFNRRYKQKAFQKMGRNKSDVKGYTQMSLERAWFHVTTNPRWVGDGWPALRLQPGDLQCKDALNYARGRAVYVPSTRKDFSETLRDMKEVVDAGPLSDFRMVAAMMSLRALAEDNFRDLGAAWLGEIFQTGHIYRNTSTNKTMVCLGFNYKIAFMWNTISLGDRYFKLASNNLDESTIREQFDTVCLTKVHPGPSKDGE
ncbi:unnamed protein product, partial [Effrenium voratum]